MKTRNCQNIKTRGAFYLLSCLLLLNTGCSIKKMAIGKVGDALAGGSSTTFAADDDPELIKAAVPFSLKLMESLLAQVPEHEGLLLASASGFTQYGYAFVQLEADEVEPESFTKAEEIRQRARRLYKRARAYGLRALETRYPGFEKKLRSNPAQAVALLKKRDVPALYWTAASWGLTISPDDPGSVGEAPIVEALIDRALVLDEAFGDGAIHSFLINYEMARQGAKGDPAERARKHFERAIELAKGRQAGPYVTLAEAVTIKAQNVKEFEALLNQALAVNPDEFPEFRLVNMIMQKRARWLLSRKEELFLIEEPQSEEEKKQ